MNKVIFDIFHQISQVPRLSKHEEQISQWLMDFAAAHHIDGERDEVNNVILRVPATPGYEDKEGLILQAHMDMVGEKDGNVQHDFLRDPIDYYEDGDWLKAHGTTLGGDDGIGVSMALAILTDPTFKHPAIEALFTADEEAGMTGAINLKKGILKGTRVINLDSEEDGFIYIGCSGGIDTLGKMHYTPVALSREEMKAYFAMQLTATGFLGGHSGTDIHIGRASAVKVVAEYLYQLSDKGIQLAYIDGGNQRNAIARECKAIFAVPQDKKHEVIAAFNVYKNGIEQEFGRVETTMQLQLESCEMPATFIPNEHAIRLLHALHECPHGMIAMCKDIPDMVETSTNLAAVRMRDGYIEVSTSQRSSIEEDKHAIKDRVHKILAAACDEVTHGDGYPGWEPNVHSRILQVAVKTYKELFAGDPKVLTIHAGLECGLFLEKYPNLDIISIGPDMLEVHSPRERLNIPSTDRCYNWVRNIIENL
ncbi:MAG: aminoacyl-histidine dipeptidase [Paludibacteraceae bacterium]|nr:aminoacyl-histidine dipeptidase [Paludibacteraceae bacterium]